MRTAISPASASEHGLFDVRRIESILLAELVSPALRVPMARDTHGDTAAVGSNATVAVEFLARRRGVGNREINKTSIHQPILPTNPASKPVFVSLSATGSLSAGGEELAGESETGAVDGSG